jgi:hypothetical protein
MIQVHDSTRQSFDINATAARLESLESLRNHQDKKRPLNLLERNKRLSQLIAQSWLPGGEYIKKQFLGTQEQILELLVAENILVEEEAKYTRVEVDMNPPGPPYLGAIKEGLPPYLLNLYIPYPQRSTEVKDEQLMTWVNSTIESAPFSPFEISQWIPYSC